MSIFLAEKTNRLEAMRATWGVSKEMISEMTTWGMSFPSWGDSSNEADGRFKQGSEGGVAFNLITCEATCGGRTSGAVHTPLRSIVFRRQKAGRPASGVVLSCGYLVVIWCSSLKMATSIVDDDAGEVEMIRAPGRAENDGTDRTSVAHIPPVGAPVVATTAQTFVEQTMYSSILLTYSQLLKHVFFSFLWRKCHWNGAEGMLHPIVDWLAAVKFHWTVK